MTPDWCKHISSGPWIADDCPWKTKKPSSCEEANDKNFCIFYSNEESRSRNVGDKREAVFFGLSL